MTDTDARDAYWLSFKSYWQRSRLLERLIETLYRYHIQPGDTVIDGGANRGRHTLPLVETVGSAGQVLAVEAIPTLADALRSMTGDLPVKVYSKALSNHAGKVEFSHCVERNSRSGIHARQFASTLEIEKITVEAVTIDELIPAGQRVSFIKLDLEGGEFHALQGANRVLRQDRPLLVVEHGGREGEALYGYKNDDYYRFLQDLDYSVIDILGRKMTLERFGSPDIFYFIAFNSQDAAHLDTRNMIPTFLIHTAQQVTLETKVRFQT